MQTTATKVNVSILRNVLYIQDYFVYYFSPVFFKKRIDLDLRFSIFVSILQMFW